MKLPEQYIEGKKILPKSITLTNDVIGYYLSKSDKKIKKVKIKEGTYFYIFGIYRTYLCYDIL